MLPRLLPATERSRWVWLLVVTLIVRGTVLWGMFGKLADDPDGYRQLAENLAREGIYGYGEVGSHLTPTAYRPPLYPLLLSQAVDAQWQLSLVRVALLHLALGTATVLLTRDLGQRLKLRNWSTLAALVVACDPILLNQSALVMTETLAAFLAVVSLWCLVRLTQTPEWWNAMLAGGALGLATLCRPTFLPWIAMSLLVVVLVSQLRWSRRLGHAAVLLASASLFLLPWGIRNYFEIGKFTVTTTHGGYTFWLGNNSGFFDALRENAAHNYGPRTSPEVVRDAVYRIPEFQTGDQVEPWMDKLDYRKALYAIRNQPFMFAYACVYRLYQLVNPLPHPTEHPESLLRRLLRYAVAVWYCGVFLLAAVGCRALWRQLRTPPWLWGVLLCVTFTVVHTFYWTNLRMRAPLMPFIALLAAAGAAQLAQPFYHAHLQRRTQLRRC